MVLVCGCAARPSLLIHLVERIYSAKSVNPRATVEPIMK
jgi:hypothetical protein